MRVSVRTGHTFFPVSLQVSAVEDGGKECGGGGGECVRSQGKKKKETGGRANGPAGAPQTGPYS